MKLSILLLRLVIAVTVVVVCTVFLLWMWLRPAPTEWSLRVPAAALNSSVSVRKLVALTSRPAVARLVAHHSLRTTTGTWQIEVQADAVNVVCSPCLLKLRALGAAPLYLASAKLTLKQLHPDQYSGALQFRRGEHQITLPWEATLDLHGATVNIAAENTSLADMVTVFGEGLADISSAKISGTVSFNLRARFPEGTVAMQPRFEGFSVAGLGTEQLLDIQLPQRCRTASRRAITGWLPKAVIAAEDQAFRSHAGYDPVEIAASLQGNGQRDGHFRGASTLTQQLARLLYTGAEQTAQRKLQELLYAVEMEQTLGKARILQLYLAVAPWGQDVCGAENAARRYLGKSASVVTPLEAAWLAGLLVNPEAQIHRQSAHGRIDAERTTRILNAMRSMGAWRRQLAIADIPTFEPRIIRASATPPLQQALAQAADFSVGP